MAAEWTIQWEYRHSLVSEAHGLTSVRDSRKMPDGTRMVLGKLAENGQWVVFKQRESGKDKEGRILPGELTEFITPENGVQSKIAYNSYIEVRDAAGLKPTPKAPKEKGEDEGENETQGEDETQGSEEPAPAKSKSKKSSK